jgi:hypothetical protein
MIAMLHRRWSGRCFSENVPFRPCEAEEAVHEAVGRRLYGAGAGEGHPGEVCPPPGASVVLVRSARPGALQPMRRRAGDRGIGRPASPARVPASTEARPQLLVPTERMPDWVVEDNRKALAARRPARELIGREPRRHGAQLVQGSLRGSFAAHYAVEQSSGRREASAGSVSYAPRRSVETPLFEL